MIFTDYWKVLFGDGKYGPFLSQKADGKMIFTWYFWVFYDIPGLGKYGFLCSVAFTAYELIEEEAVYLKIALSGQRPFL